MRSLLNSSSLVVRYEVCCPRCHDVLPSLRIPRRLRVLKRIGREVSSLYNQDDIYMPRLYLDNASMCVHMAFVVDMAVMRCSQVLWRWTKPTADVEW